jgi:hypothetical protein
MNWPLAIVRRAIAASLMAALAQGAAHADERVANVKQNVFVAAKEATSLTVIDAEAEEVIGSLDVGLEPKQFVVSDAVAKVAAIDQASGRIAIVELVSGSVRILDLDFTPRRLALALDGLKLAALGEHQFVLFDLLFVKETARATGLPLLRDALFSGDGQKLLASFGGVDGVEAFDAVNAQSLARIEVSAPVLALSRSATGREGYAKATGGKVAHLDLIAAKLIEEIDLGSHAQLTPTGLGRWLLAFDPGGETVRIAQARPLERKATLDAPVGITALYSAWFDTVAVAPAGRKAVIFDLEGARKIGEIDLDSPAGPGAMTADGRKLFLPLEDAGEVAIIDAQIKKLKRTIAVGARPVAAVMAGGYGVCH